MAYHHCQDDLKLPRLNSCCFHWRGKHQVVLLEGRRFARVGKRIQDVVSWKEHSERGEMKAACWNGVVRQYIVNIKLRRFSMKQNDVVSAYSVRFYCPNCVWTDFFGFLIKKKKCMIDFLFSERSVSAWFFGFSIRIFDFLLTLRESLP